MFRLLAPLIFSLAASQAAGEFRLGFPVDCTLGETCFIQNYVDHDLSRRWRDFTCGPLSYDGHKGTDIALLSRAAMRDGASVLAAAPGTVKARRDGIADKGIKAVRKGRECGNGVVLDHGNGWTTQYCHMKRGSVKVTLGQHVPAGGVLGRIGYSGQTEFPHLHIEVRHKGKLVDPFAPRSLRNCGKATGKTLWQTPPKYQPGGMILSGFADHVPAYGKVKSGNVAKTVLPRHTTAIVLFGYAYGGRKGDDLTLRIDGPRGPVLQETFTLEKNQAQFYQAAGRKRGWFAWPAGRYTGRVILRRKGQIVDEQVTAVTLR